MEPIRVMVADDHTMFREAIVHYLNAQEEIEVIKEAADGHETLALVGEARPAVLLLDLVMPDLDGLEILRQVRERSPETRVLILTGYFDEGLVLQALQQGAIGYFLKGGSTAGLVKAIRAVANGEAWVERNLIGKFLDDLPRANRRQNPKEKLGNQRGVLTKREEEVTRLVAMGHSNKEIADRLSITDKTVKTHLTSIFKKVDASHRVQLALHALQRGFILRKALHDEQPPGERPPRR